MKKILFLMGMVLFLECRAEPASLVRATDLKKDPAADSATVAALQANAAVDAGERRGGWVRVKAGSAEGWVRMLALRYGGPGEARQGDSGVAQAINVARTGSSGTQVTTGVRGLDDAMLANARPNAAELAKMAQYGATADAAAKYAVQGGLERRRVEVK